MTTNNIFEKPAVDPIPRLSLRPAEAAEAVGVSERTLADWLKLPGFPVAKIGGCRVIPVQELRQWLGEQAGREDV